MTTTPSPSKRSFLARVFISPDEPRLRAGWRLLLHTLLLVALAIVFGIAASAVISGPGTAEFFQEFPDVAFLINGIGAGLVITLSVYLARRFLDRRSFTSLGLRLDRRALYDVLVGIAIAFVIMGMIYLAELALGWLHFEGFAWDSTPPFELWSGVVGVFVIFVAVGWYEELISRGYHLQNLIDGTNLAWGVIISSLVFGLAHLGNPGASWTAVLGIFLAGFFLAYPFVRTRMLWLSIGLHIGWNFFEGVVFGFQVSGMETPRLILHTVTGPDLWTGAAFGPEAGLIVVPALLLGTVLIYFYTRDRKPAES